MQLKYLKIFRKSIIPPVKHDHIDNTINITKIESRPSKKQLGKYIFWMDIDGHSNDNNLNTIFEKIKTITNTLKIIGSYQKSTNIH